MLISKPLQVASRALHIPAEKIHICETGTNTVPNTTATAASASSDLNGMAVVVGTICINLSTNNSRHLFSNTFGFEFKLLIEICCLNKQKMN